MITGPNHQGVFTSSTLVNFMILLLIKIPKNISPHKPRFPGV